MRISINGRTVDVDESWTLAHAVESLGISDPRGIAAAVDREVIPADRWEAVILLEGQEIEVLRAVQGGSI